MGLEVLLPLLIKYAIIPEVARLVRATPDITDADILLKLPADLQGLVSKNQPFLDAIRGAAGASPAALAGR